jgi:hypothetical protein
MSTLGHKRTFRNVRSMSALPPKADILRCGRDRRYSITSSARSKSPVAMFRPKDFHWAGGGHQTNRR